MNLNKWKNIDFLTEIPISRQSMIGLSWDIVWKNSTNKVESVFSISISIFKIEFNPNSNAINLI